MNFEKHTPPMLVVAVTARKQTMDPVTYKFTVLDETEVIHTEMGPVRFEGIRADWGKLFVSAEVIGTFTSEWYDGYVEHGVSDNKGRVLGHRFIITRERDGWRMRPQATRDATKYGALTKSFRCKSLADAMALAEVKAAAGKKAAAKAALRGGSKK